MSERDAAYDYIHRVYGARFCIGDKVEHTEAQKCGEVMRPKASHLHYVRVDFGPDGTGLCHPRALKIISRGPNWTAAREDTP